MPANRLLDLKLKCIFDFTEAEQQKLQHLQQQSDQSTTIATSQQQPAPAQAQQQQKQAANTTSSSVASNKSSTKAAFNNAAADSNDSHGANDFESMPSIAHSNAQSTTNKSAAGASATGISREKNDNILNELKLAKQENEALRKEINRLKVIETTKLILYKK